MAALFKELPFSEFLHHPALTAGLLDSVRVVVLRRRGSPDLALTRVDQAERDATVIDFTSRLLASFAKSGEKDSLRRVLPEALPWSRFLPDSDLDQMISELIDMAQAAASVRNLAPMAVLLEQWRHSAEIYADAEVYKQLSADPEGDLGAVPDPKELV